MLSICRAKLDTDLYLHGSSVMLRRKDGRECWSVRESGYNI